MVKEFPGWALRIAGGALLCVGLAVGLVIGSSMHDADAARKPLLKTLWAVVDADGGIVEGESKGVVSSSKGGVGSFGIAFNRDRVQSRREHLRETRHPQDVLGRDLHR